MKKFVILVCTLCTIVLMLLVGVNYFVDSAGIFHSDDICNIIINGFKQSKNVTNVSNLNERMLKEKFVELHKGESFDYVIIGASRVMTISSDVFKGKKVLNLGMPASKIEDLIAIVELCKENEVNFDRIIIGVEPTLFNDGDTDTRWMYLQHYFNAFLDEPRAVSTESNYWSLLSISYFQSNIRMIPKIVRGDFKIKYVDNIINKGMTMRMDGSIYYAESYRNKTQEQIDNEALTWTHSSFSNYNYASIERVNLFNRLLDSLQKRQISVVFFKCPYHPLFYVRVNKIRGIAEGEEWINSIASKRNIPIIGSYNPVDEGVMNTDFYDAAHVRKESIDRLFLQYH